MADYDNFQRGGTKYPLPTSTANATIRDVDPGIFYYLDFFQYVIQTYIGGRLMAEVAATGATQIAQPVAYTFPDDPLPYFQEEMFDFPLLAMWREKETLHGRTTSKREDMCDVCVAYILPPLSPAQAERILPLRKAISEILDDRVDLGRDPGYTPPGGLQGDQLYNYSGVDEVWFFEGNYASYPIKSNQFYPAWAGKLKMKAVARPEPAGLVVYGGSDVNQDLQATDGTVISGVVQYIANNAPTISGVVPAQGSRNGGQPIVLTGAGFEKGATVSIGGQACTGIVVQSPTVLWAISPPGAPGLATVTVTNRDGRTGSLVNGFTFL